MQLIILLYCKLFCAGINQSVALKSCTCQYEYTMEVLRWTFRGYDVIAATLDKEIDEHSKKFLNEFTNITHQIILTEDKKNAYYKSNAVVYLSNVNLENKIVDNKNDLGILFYIHLLQKVLTINHYRNASQLNAQTLTDARRITSKLFYMCYGDNLDRVELIVANIISIFRQFASQHSRIFRSAKGFYSLEDCKYMHFNSHLILADGVYNDDAKESAIKKHLTETINENCPNKTEPINLCRAEIKFGDFIRNFVKSYISHGEKGYVVVSPHRTVSSKKVVKNEEGVEVVTNIRVSPLLHMDLVKYKAEYNQKPIQLHMRKNEFLAIISFYILKLNSETYDFACSMTMCEEDNNYFIKCWASDIASLVPSCNAQDVANEIVEKKNNLTVKCLYDVYVAEKVYHDGMTTALGSGGYTTDHRSLSLEEDKAKKYWTKSKSALRKKLYKHINTNNVTKESDISYNKYPILHARLKEVVGQINYINKTFPYTLNDLEILDFVKNGKAGVGRRCINADIPAEVSAVIKKYKKTDFSNLVTYEYKIKWLLVHLYEIYSIRYTERDFVIAKLPLDTKGSNKSICKSQSVMSTHKQVIDELVSDEQKANACLDDLRKTIKY